jgi:hypothetical protein
MHFFALKAVIMARYADNNHCCTTLASSAYKDAHADVRATSCLGLELLV